MTRPTRLLWMALLALAPLTYAQEKPAQPPTDPAAPAPPTQTEPQPVAEPELVLRELLVLQTDRFDETANSPVMIPTTLYNPIKHTGRAKRTNADGSYDYTPMPLGFVTFQGEMLEPIRLRLTLVQSGRDTFHAHWPASATTGKYLLEWPRLAPAGEADRVVPIEHEDDWLNVLRESEDRSWFRTQTRQGFVKERFLLYDTSFKFESALSLSLSENTYAISSQVPERAAPPITVMMRKTDGGWATDTLAAPWRQPSLPIAEKLKANSAGISLDEALQPIRELLADRGYNAREITLAMEMVASAGLDLSAMSLVYVLPMGVLDEHIKLQIRPKPDGIVRTAIVVVNNVDPDLHELVNALIDDLGSDQWAVRHRAQKQLMSLNHAAIKKVQQVKDHSDPEVAFRARQILDAHDWKTNANK